MPYRFKYECSYNMLNLILLLSTIIYTSNRLILRNIFKPLITHYIYLRSPSYLSLLSYFFSIVFNYFTKSTCSIDYKLLIVRTLLHLACQASLSYIIAESNQLLTKFPACAFIITSAVTIDPQSIRPPGIRAQSCNERSNDTEKGKNAHRPPMQLMVQY